MRYASHRSTQVFHRLANLAEWLWTVTRWVVGLTVASFATAALCHELGRARGELVLAALVTVGIGAVIIGSAPTGRHPSSETRAIHRRANGWLVAGAIAVPTLVGLAAVQPVALIALAYVVLLAAIGPAADGVYQLGRLLVARLRTSRAVAR